jgi:hypothetical protein
VLRERVRAAKFFFLLQHAKMGKKYSNGQKLYQMDIKYTKFTKNIQNYRKIYQMTIKNIKNSMVFQNIPKIGRENFLGVKIFR